MHTHTHTHTHTRTLLWYHTLKILNFHICYTIDSSPFTLAPPFEKAHTQIPNLSKDYINEKKRRKITLATLWMVQSAKPMYKYKKHEKIQHNTSHHVEGFQSFSTQTITHEQHTLSVPTLSSRMPLNNERNSCKKNNPHPTQPQVFPLPTGPSDVTQALGET